MNISAGILRRPLASLSLLASALIFVAVALAGDAQAQREPQAVSPQSQKQIQRERTGAQAQTQAQRRELRPGAGRESGRAGQGVSRSAEFRTAACLRAARPRSTIVSKRCSRRAHGIHLQADGTAWTHFRSSG